jgi:Zn-dependent M28 family amino/carboxypeptidase
VVSADALRRAVTATGLRGHLDALQAIADANGGTRASGTTGYDDSASYVYDTLTAAGYDVRYQEFEAPVFRQVGPSILDRVGPQPAHFVDGVEFRAMLFSASGDVTANVTAVAFDVGLEGALGGGCSPADFAGFPNGDIALLQRGPCFRRDQVVNAQSAGASAVIVSYPPFSDGHVLRPTLIDPALIHVPALAVSNKTGTFLEKATHQGDVVVHVSVDARSEQAPVANVIADMPGRPSRKVVMAGAHLDSVVDGPGINDNGTGVAALLETAVGLAGTATVNPVRFAFWGGEEMGLFGSRHYVDSLAQPERKSIAVYLNFDMLGSPNQIPFVYGGTDGESAALQDILRAALREAGGTDAESLDLEGSSDHASFQEADIPVGGIYSGSGEVKTPAQAELYGGTAGEPADDCYHLACDTIDRVVMNAFEPMADAVAHAIFTLAMLTQIDQLAG